MIIKRFLAITGLFAVSLTGLTSTAIAKVEGDTITLGSALSLTGKYATNGLHTQRGYDFAVDRINATGGVSVGGKSYKLTVKYYDDESTPARGAQLAERLIQQDGVDYMLGPYSSGMTKAIAPVSEQFGVPMIEAEGASRSLFTQGYRYLFAVLSTTDLYLPGAVHFAADQKKSIGKSPSDTKVAMAFEGDPFSMDIRAGLVELIDSYILIVSGHSKGAATAARQIDEMKINVPIIALTHCEAAKVHEKFPNASTGFLCPTQWTPNIDKKDPMFGTASDWNADFIKAHPSYSSVPYQSAQASAAVYVWKEAFEAANSFDKDAVRDAIAGVEMETFYGDVKFGPDGNNIAKPMFLRQIGSDGSYNLVQTFNDLNYPRNVSY